MSSFYGNGGGSGGSGSGGDVSSVNGKRGAVVLTAADVHALPDSTQVPSLEGFATEAWVQNRDSAKAWYGFNSEAVDWNNPTNLNLDYVTIPYGVFTGNFPGRIYFDGDLKNDFFFKTYSLLEAADHDLSKVGVKIVISNPAADFNVYESLNFYSVNIIEDPQGENNLYLQITIHPVSQPYNHILLKFSYDENGPDENGVECIIESGVETFFETIGSIEKIIFVIKIPLVGDSGGGTGDGGSLIVGCTINGTLEENGAVTLTSTWQEIYDAAALGKTVVLDLRPDYEDITYLQGISSNNYQVMFSYFELFANSPNDFPTTPNNLPVIK